MSTLTQQQLQQLEQQMRSRLDELQGDVRREADGQDNYVDIASELADPGDQSFASLTVDLGNAAILRDSQEARSLEAALARIGEGGYGECIECGYDIPFERLEAQPAAERCIGCQAMYEKTHADAGRGATL